MNGVQPHGIDRALYLGMLHSVFVDDAAELLGVSRRTVYYRIREGKLTTVRTRCGSQRVLMESIIVLLAAEASTNRGADASNRDLSGRSPAP
jgi:excisionase family DNA binding protein